ncbi:hypothetical protein V5O48_017083 [Marasmius crinis-equi]|uniref:Uncharacterized protein n=1 Tax=Marasmius crinis-equi TaxID=585013 RepID=A0ABR3EQ04_9AGAR
MDDSTRKCLLEARQQFINGESNVAQFTDLVNELLASESQAQERQQWIAYISTLSKLFWAHASETEFEWPEPPIHVVPIDVDAEPEPSKNLPDSAPLVLDGEQTLEAKRAEIRLLLDGMMGDIGPIRNSSSALKKAGRQSDWLMYLIVFTEMESTPSGSERKELAKNWPDLYKKFWKVNASKSVSDKLDNDNAAGYPKLRQPKEKKGSTGSAGQSQKSSATPSPTPTQTTKPIVPPSNPPAVFTSTS